MNDMSRAFQEAGKIPVASVERCKGLECVLLQIVGDEGHCTVLAAANVYRGRIEGVNASDKARAALGHAKDEFGNSVPDECPEGLAKI